MFYRQNKDVNRFLRSNNSISRTNYFRVLALSSIDVLLTLPFGIVDTALEITSGIAQEGDFPFYPGWAIVHSNWAPVTLPYAEQKALGTSFLAGQYYNVWSSTILTFIIFGLFGLTMEARESYWHVLCTVGRWVGWVPSARVGDVNSTLVAMQFNANPQGTMVPDRELGCV